MFLSQSGAHQVVTCQKGVKSCQKGYFPNLVETAGYILAQAFQKGVLSHIPLLITLVHRLYTREKRRNSGWLGGAQGARPTLWHLSWSRFDGEHGRRRPRIALSSFLSRFWGYTPFCQMICKICRHQYRHDGLACRLYLSTLYNSIIWVFILYLHNYYYTLPQQNRSIANYRYMVLHTCLLYTSPSPRDQRGSRMPSSA